MSDARGETAKEKAKEFEKKPFNFPDFVPTDVDCATWYNTQLETIGIVTFVELLANLLNLDSGLYNLFDPLEWFLNLVDLAWPFSTIFGLFLPAPLRTTSYSLGRISMLLQGIVKPSVSAYNDFAICASQKMKGGMWNDWGAQQVYYSSEMKGLNVFYD